MNGYKCFFRGKSIEVRADSTYEAQQRAAALFKARKAFEVAVVLVELRGQPYRPTLDF